MGDEPTMAICRVASCVEPRPRRTATAVASLKLNLMLKLEGDDEVVVLLCCCQDGWFQESRARIDVSPLSWQTQDGRWTIPSGQTGWKGGLYAAGSHQNSP
jgi:hypothetical protein